MSSNARWCSLCRPPRLSQKTCEWVWHIGSILKFSWLLWTVNKQTNKQTKKKMQNLNPGFFCKHLLWISNLTNPCCERHIWPISTSDCHLSVETGFYSDEWKESGWKFIQLGIIKMVDFETQMESTQCKHSYPPAPVICQSGLLTGESLWFI